MKLEYFLNALLQRYRKAHKKFLEQTTSTSQIFNMYHINVLHPPLQSHTNVIFHHLNVTTPYLNHKSIFLKLMSIDSKHNCSYASQTQHKNYWHTSNPPWSAQEHVSLQFPLPSARHGNFKQFCYSTTQKLSSLVLRTS